VTVVDLRPFLMARQSPLYWDADYHLNPDGHRAVAEGVARSIGDLLRG